MTVCWTEGRLCAELGSRLPCRRAIKRSYARRLRERPATSNKMTKNARRTASPQSCRSGRGRLIETSHGVHSAAASRRLLRA